MRAKKRLFGLGAVLLLTSGQALACSVAPPHAAHWSSQGVVEDGEQVEVRCDSFTGGFSSALLAITIDARGSRPTAAIAADSKPEREFVYGDAEGESHRWNGRLGSVKLTHIVPEGGIVRAVASLYGGRAYCSITSSADTIETFMEERPARGRVTLSSARDRNTATVTTVGETLSFMVAEDGIVTMLDHEGRANADVGSRPTIVDGGTGGTRHFIHDGVGKAFVWWVETGPSVSRKGAPPR